MEALSERICLRIVSADAHLAQLAFDSLADASRNQQTFRRTNHPPPSSISPDTTMRATCIRQKDAIYTEVSCHSSHELENLPAQSHAFIVVFNGTIAESFNACLNIVMDQVVPRATERNRIVVVMLEHIQAATSAFKPRKTDARGLSMFMAQHRRIGYKRFDLTTGESVLTLAKEMLFMVHDDGCNNCVDTLAGQRCKSFIDSMMDSFVNLTSPLLCSPSPPTEATVTINEPPAARVVVKFNDSPITDEKND